MNKGVYLSLLSIGLAQAIKIPLHYIKKKGVAAGSIFQYRGHAQLPFCRGFYVNNIHCLKTRDADF